MEGFSCQPLQNPSLRKTQKHKVKPSSWEYLLCRCPPQGSSPDDGIEAKPSGPPFHDDRRKSTRVNFLSQIAVVCSGVVLRCRPPAGGLLGLT